MSVLPTYSDCIENIDLIGGGEWATTVPHLLFTSPIDVFSTAVIDSIEEKFERAVRLPAESDLGSEHK